MGIQEALGKLLRMYLQLIWTKAAQKGIDAMEFYQLGHPTASIFCLAPPRIHTQFTTTYS